jgi:hypothetical protein
MGADKILLKDYVVIEELLTLGTILGSPSGSTNQGTKNKPDKTKSNRVILT